MIDINIENLELTKVQIEIKKLELEEKKLKIEKFKNSLTIFGSLIPLIAIALTIYYGVKSQNEQAKNQFRLKAAEFIFNSQNIQEGKTKVIVFQKLFPNLLDEDFSNIKDRDLNEFYLEEERQNKKKIFEILSSKATTKEEIINDWKKLFPGDTWPNDLLKK